MNAKKALRIVWDNQSDKRFVPRNYGLDTTGWGVWDNLKQVWADDVLGQIDPTEPLVKN